MAASSAATGREAAKSAIAVRPAANARRPSSRTITAFSACTATGRPSCAARHMPSYSARSSQAAKSSMPLSAMKALKPTTPPAASSSMCVEIAGDEPAPEREVDVRRALAAATLASSARRRRSAGRVERHVDAAREASGSERARAAAPALPGGAPGIVEVHVGVDQAGQDVEPASRRSSRARPLRVRPPARARRSRRRPSPRPSSRCGRSRRSSRGAPAIVAAVHVVSATIDSTYVREWADLLVRWLHVMAGIAWIGASFYFILLDNHLEAPANAEDAEAGVMGESWEVHGGGFYHVQKYRVAPRILPERLAWFKWEAYTTWLSGFALLCIVYFSNARAYLIDRSVADLTVPEAIAISVGLLVAAWLVYDVLCRMLGRWPKLLALALFGFIALSAYAAGRLFAPRAMFIEVGSMIGTMMVGNVFFVIIPGHWELIRAKRAGREPDPGAGHQGQAALGPQQLPDAAGAADDAQQPLPVRLRARPRLARAVRVRRARGLRAPLLQPAPCGSHEVVDAGGGGGGRGRAGDLAGPGGRVVGACEQRQRRGREAALSHAPVRELPHAARRARHRGHRPQPGRRQALARARDQPRHERPGRHAAVREQALEGPDRAGRRLRVDASPALLRSRFACRRCSRAISSSSARTRCPPRTTGAPPT